MKEVQVKSSVKLRRTELRHLTQGDLANANALDTSIEKLFWMEEEDKMNKLFTYVPVICFIVVILFIESTLLKWLLLAGISSLIVLAK